MIPEVVLVNGLRFLEKVFVTQNLLIYMDILYHLQDGLSIRFYTSVIIFRSWKQGSCLYHQKNYKDTPTNGMISQVLFISIAELLVRLTDG